VDHKTAVNFNKKAEYYFLEKRNSIDFRDKLKEAQVIIEKSNINDIKK
jgi:hypothetical protein